MAEPCTDHGRTATRLVRRAENRGVRHCGAVPPVGPAAAEIDLRNEVERACSKVDLREQKARRQRSIAGNREAVAVRLARHPMRQCAAVEDQMTSLARGGGIAHVQAHQAVTAHGGLHPVAAGDDGYTACEIAEIVHELGGGTGAFEPGHPVKSAGPGDDKYGFAVGEYPRLCRSFRDDVAEMRRLRQNYRLDESEVRKTPDLNDMARLVCGQHVGASCDHPVDLW